MLGENPILNSPFQEPEQYWDFRQGQPVRVQGRRPAGYYLRPRLRGEQASLLEEEFVPLQTVNVIRERVRGWRSRGYPGVTALTRHLLRHWTDPDRERRLFFCQMEAAETLIWLIEASPAERQGIEIPRDETLVRYASKMATGSGKTLVMGMVIAWQVLNKLANPQDRRFSDAVLVVCPNLTIRERLQVLLLIVKAAVGYRIGRPDRLGPGPEVVQDREAFHRERRLQRTVFEIAAEITQRLKDRRADWEDRRVLFPQVLEIVWRYVEDRVRFAEEGMAREEIALLKYRQRIVERLTHAIEPDTDAGESPLLPTIERFRPIGSTSEVLFRTVRPTVGTKKSHISHVVLDAPTWEHSVAYRLEQMTEVNAYARNDHLDFTIPYEFQGTRHEYRPDYLVKLKKADARPVTLILEVKGFETEQDRAKEVAARRWVRAVNHHGEFGRWDFRICRDPLRLSSAIRDAAGAV